MRLALRASVFPLWLPSSQRAHRFGLWLAGRHKTLFPTRCARGLTEVVKRPEEAQMGSRSLCCRLKFHLPKASGSLTVAALVSVTCLLMETQTETNTLAAAAAANPSHGTKLHFGPLQLRV